MIPETPFIYCMFNLFTKLNIYIHTNIGLRRGSGVGLNLLVCNMMKGCH